MDTNDIKKLESLARAIRLHIIQMIGIGQKGHIGGSCSIADVVTALYFSKMRHDPANPHWPDRDRFILSKGHAALVQYAALAEAGYFPKDEFKKTKQLGSILQGHPDLKSTPGVEANTGSLGQGLSIACGIAAGLRIDGRDSRVYCVVGDGELAEGQIWEAAMAASAFKLDRLVAILDRNGLQAMGAIEQRFDTNPLVEKWRAFGWHVVEIDGHDMQAIVDALNAVDAVKGRPKMILARTVKGAGIPFAENRVEFHNGQMNAAAVRNGMCTFRCREGGLMQNIQNPREVYGRTLVELGREFPNVVVLEADLGKSTMSCYFEEAFPERFFEMGIAEANMTSFAAGLSLTGKVPFTNSFAVFAAGRAFDQIRQSICIPALNVRIVGSSCGLSDFGDGSTHQSIEDVSIMRSLPNMTVLAPADGNETRTMTRALVQYPGPVYMRITRNDLPDVMPADEPFVAGKPHLIRQGDDVVLFASGQMVSLALVAAEIVASEGISLRVVNVSSLKPIDDSALRALVDGMKGVVTAEEHSLIGGLSSLIHEVIQGRPFPMQSIGIRDSFGQSAHSYEDLLQAYGLTPAHIAAAVRKVVH